MATRRVSDTFRAGMITDVVGAEGSVYDLSDMYVRRSGELAARGPIVSHHATATNLGYNCGWSAAQFHPNFGVGACRGRKATSNGDITQATAFQLLGAPLQTSVTPQLNALNFALISEGAAGNEIPLHAGVASAATAATGLPVEKIIQATNTGEEIVMAGEIGSLYKWGGSLYAAYNTGTVAVATASGVASRVITGTGTTWGANVQEGQYILIDTVAEKANTFQRAYRITKVISNTQIEIELPIWKAPGTGLAYRIQSAAIVQSPDGVWNGTDERPRQVGIACYHQGRLFTAGVSDNRSQYNTVYDLDSVRWSGTLDENANGFSHLDLWHNNARVSVFPGIGGSIRGLASMGNELVVIKAHALFRITGSMNYDGTGSGLGIQIISTEVGANGFGAWTMTSRGLVIASRDGLYLYDGEQVTSLTDGKIKRWWENNFTGKEYSVTQYEDKVIVTPTLWTAVSGNKLVWDAEQNIFWSMTSSMPEYTAGISTYTAADEWVGDYAFPCGSNDGIAYSSAQHSYLYDELTHMNHKKGWQQWYLRGDGAVLGGGGVHPKPALVTHPIAMGEDSLSEGRVNNVYVHAALPHIQGDTPTGTRSIHVAVTSGATPTGISNQFSEEEYNGVDTISEYGVEHLYIGNPEAVGTRRENIFRVPIDGNPSSPYSRVVLDSQSMDDGYSTVQTVGWGLRIYAVGVDIEESENRGPA